MEDKRFLLLESYIHDTMGFRVVLIPWSGYFNLPIFLQENYTAYQTDLLGKRFLLISYKGEEVITPFVLKKQIRIMEDAAGLRGIYWADTIEAFNRKRLIEQKVPFIVPGNQMYLPDLGIDLREYYKSKARKPETMSPSTQAVIIYALVNNDYRDYKSGDLANQTGYASMTIKRVFDELVGFELAKNRFENREMIINFKHHGRELWDKALPMMQNPRKKEVGIINIIQNKFEYKYAGLSALSKQSNLAGPELLVYAMSREEYKTAIQNKYFQESESNWYGDGYVEIWRYSPALITKGDIVDPLSLYLSLYNDEDARVRGALKDLIEDFKW
jgi:hypothetical protein